MKDDRDKLYADVVYMKQRKSFEEERVEEYMRRKIEEEARKYRRQIVKLIESVNGDIYEEYSEIKRAKEKIKKIPTMSLKEQNYYGLFLPDTAEEIFVSYLELTEEKRNEDFSKTRDALEKVKNEMLEEIKKRNL